MADPVLQFLTDFLKVNFSGMCMKLQRLSDWKKNPESWKIPDFSEMTSSERRVNGSCYEVYWNISCQSVAIASIKFYDSFFSFRNEITFIFS